MSQFVDQYRPCMECDAQGSAKSVMPGGLGAEVRNRDTNEVVGYLHANCKATWMAKHGEDNFSFRRF